jgi:hypothetical protein
MKYFVNEFRVEKINEYLERKEFIVKLFLKKKNILFRKKKLTESSCSMHLQMSCSLCKVYHDLLNRQI